MLRKLCATLALGAVVAASSPLPCHAYVHTMQFPLTAFRDYPGGSGLVTYSRMTGETSRSDGSTLIIEVKNVPLPSGTELRVIVHGRDVGTLKLDHKRNGRMVMEANYKSSVPRVDPGSFVVLKRASGERVLW